MREKVKRIWKIMLEELALFSFEFLLVIFFGLIALIVFVKFSTLLLNQQLNDFDFGATNWIRSFASPAMDNFMRAITFLGNRQFIIWPAIGIFIYFLFIKPHRWYSIKIPVVALGSISANLILKELFHRERPVLEHMVKITSELSFPSGHAMFSISFYGLLIYIAITYIKNKTLARSLSLLFLVMIILIGISRIYLGVHFPSDVIAGFAAGFLWLIISINIIRFIERKLAEKMAKASLKTSLE
jgi:membrane-associated phospholipid phosphatase